MIDFSYLSDKTGVEPSFIIKDAELNLFEEAFIYLKEKKVYIFILTVRQEYIPVTKVF